jgi:hypothetical protein
MYPPKISCKDLAIIYLHSGCKYAQLRMSAEAAVQEHAECEYSNL